MKKSTSKISLIFSNVSVYIQGFSKMPYTFCLEQCNCLANQMTVRPWRASSSWIRCPICGGSCVAMSLGFMHKKSVEVISCLTLRVSTPHISNKSFHAVPITAFHNLSLRCLSSRRGRSGNLSVKDSYKRYLFNLICQLFCYSCF